MMTTSSRLDVTCWSDTDTAWLLLVTSVTLCVVVLVQATLVQTAKDTGSLNYNVVRGCLSPALRYGMHVCVLLVLSAVQLVLLSTSSCVNLTEPVPTELLLVPLLLVLGRTALVYAILGQLWYKLRPVSWPGNPRAHKIQRQPQWDFRTHHYNEKNNTIIYQHVSPTQQQSSQLLTGEVVGRDIWQATTTSVSPRKTPTKTKQHLTASQEKRVQEMASGGLASAGFNPARNPNRYGCVLFGLE